MNLEMTILANATGLVPDVRGMHCPEATLDTVTQVLLPKDEGGILQSTGVVEVVKGAEPSGGVFVVATTSHPQIRKDLQYLKMGDGPNYLFYRPYHLVGVDAIISIVKAVLSGDAIISPKGIPVADTLTVAKRDLKPGDTLDSIGGYTFYGIIDKAEIVKEQTLLPVGIAPGGKLLRHVKADEPILLDAVEIDQNSRLWKLRQRQEKMN